MVRKSGCKGLIFIINKIRIVEMSERNDFSNSMMTFPRCLTSLCVWNYRYLFPVFLPLSG